MELLFLITVIVCKILRVIVDNLIKQNSKSSKIVNIVSQLLKNYIWCIN